MCVKIVDVNMREDRSSRNTEKCVKCSRQQIVHTLLEACTSVRLAGKNRFSHKEALNALVISRYFTIS